MTIILSCKCIHLCIAYIAGSFFLCYLCNCIDLNKRMNLKSFIRRKSLLARQLIQLELQISYWWYTFISSTEYTNTHIERTAGGDSIRIRILRGQLEETVYEYAYWEGSWRRQSIRIRILRGPLEETVYEYAHWEDRWKRQSTNTHIDCILLEEIVCEYAYWEDCWRRQSSNTHIDRTVAGDSLPTRILTGLSLETVFQHAYWQNFWRIDWNIRVLVIYIGFCKIVCTVIIFLFTLSNFQWSLITLCQQIIYKLNIFLIYGPMHAGVYF